MERRKTKRFFSSLAILIAFLLLATSASNIYVKATVSQSLPTALPNFLENYFQYQATLAHLNSTQINQMRALWVHQLVLRQQLINSESNSVAKNGAIHPNIYYQNTWISSYIRNESGSGGYLFNPYSMVGSTDDGYFAEFYTPYIGSYASFVGQMNDNSAGALQFYGKLGPNGAGQIGNIIVMEVANDPDATWDTWMSGFVGFAQVTTN
jgi:hypothetical protein